MDKDVSLRLAEFAESNYLSAWTYLNKVQIIKEIEERLQKPQRVYQGKEPFCGPV